MGQSEFIPQKYFTEFPPRAWREKSYRSQSGGAGCPSSLYATFTGNSGFAEDFLTLEPTKGMLIHLNHFLPVRPHIQTALLRTGPIS